jgi:hypothetical protein
MQNGFFPGIQCSLIIRGFSIRGKLTERIYRELRGKPVYEAKQGVEMAAKNLPFVPQFSLLLFVPLKQSGCDCKLLE